MDKKTARLAKPNLRALILRLLIYRITAEIRTAMAGITRIHMNGEATKRMIAIENLNALKVSVISKHRQPTGGLTYKTTAGQAFSSNLVSTESIS